MKGLRTIFCLCLVMLLGSQGFNVYAQKKDSPENYVNAIDYRYQYFDGKLPHFADSVKFRDKIYNIFSGGYEANWQKSIFTGERMGGLDARLSFGYRLTPVHAIETDFLYSSLGRTDAI